MNIVFIHSVHNNTHPTRPLEGQAAIPLGISYLVSYLRTHGYNSHILVLNINNKKYLRKYLEDCDPHLVGFSPVATEYPFIRNIAREIKEWQPDIFLIAGGPHVSINPEACIQDSFDGLCIGEGEEALVELAQQLDQGRSPQGIPNLWLKKGRQLERNPPRPFYANLDCLPFPEREGWRPWILQPVSTISILLGRGCPFNCTYCCNHVLRNLAPGTYVRLRSPDSIIAELEELNSRYPENKDIWLEVETFGIDFDWVQELCTGIAKFNATLKESIAFGTNLRITPKVQSDAFFL